MGREVHRVGEAEEPCLRRAHRAGAYRSAVGRALELRPQRGEVAVVQRDVLVLPPVAPASGGHHTAVAAAGRVGHAVLAEVERGARVEAGAQQQHLSPYVIEARQRRVLAEMAVGAVVRDELLGQGAQRGERRLGVAAARGARRLSYGLREAAHRRCGRRRPVEGRHARPHSLPGRGAEAAHPLAVVRGRIGVLRCERRDDQGAVRADRVPQCACHRSYPAAHRPRRAHRRMHHEDTAPRHTEFGQLIGQPASAVGNGQDGGRTGNTHSGTFSQPLGMCDTPHIRPRRGTPLIRPGGGSRSRGSGPSPCRPRPPACVRTQLRRSRRAGTRRPLRRA